MANGIAPEDGGYGEHGLEAPKQCAVDQRLADGLGEVEMMCVYVCMCVCACVYVSSMCMCVLVQISCVHKLAPNRLKRERGEVVAERS